MQHTSAANNALIDSSIVALLPQEDLHLLRQRKLNERKQLKGETRAKATKRHILKIFLYCFKKRCLLQMMKAFVKWSKELPLFLKCDDLAKGMVERNLTLDSIRGSYLRDVISIKYNLDQIRNIKLESIKASHICDHCREKGIPCNRPLAIADDILYSVDALPSVDLRFLIDKAKESEHATSSALRDNLLDAGILDYETMKTLNPWEESKK